MTHARRILATAAAVGLIVAGAGFLATGKAATATANIAVSATVSNKCVLTGAPVGFGAYDPLVTNATANLDASGVFTVACTKGTTGAWIGLDTGANPSGSTRQMKSGSDLLAYELYSDSGRTAVWGNTLATGQTVATPLNKNPVNVTVYGRIAGGVDVPAGSYTDTVVATVNF